jgi:hypothetical protein
MWEEAAAEAEFEGAASRFAAGWERSRWVKDKSDQKKSCLYHWRGSEDRPCYSC